MMTMDESTGQEQEIIHGIDVPTESEDEKHLMRDFMRVFGGQAFSLIGSALVQFALVWWLAKTTASATVLVIATMMAVVPQVAFSPFIGPLVDRWDRRKVMIVSDSLTSLMVVVLAFLWWQNVVSVIHVFGLMAIRSTFSSFQWPALQASASLMVPKEHLSRVNGMYQALQGLAKIAAPALGAILLELISMEFILMIDVLTAGMAILPLALISVPRPTTEIKSDSGFSRIITEMKEGFSYMKNWKGGKFVTIALMMINFVLIPTASMTPLLIVNHFAGGAVELALMESLMGIGMIMGGIALGIWGGFKRRMLTADVALLFTSASIFLLGLVPSNMLGIAIGSNFLAGFMLPIASGSLMAVVQAIVPSKMQGRVFTVLMSLGPAMAPFGLISAAFIVEALGIQSWFLIGGILVALIAIIGACIPSLVKLGEIDQNDE